MFPLFYIYCSISNNKKKIQSWNTDDCQFPQWVFKGDNLCWCHLQGLSGQHFWDFISQATSVALLSTILNFQIVCRFNFCKAKDVTAEKLWTLSLEVKVGCNTLASLLLLAVSIRQRFIPVTTPERLALAHSSRSGGPPWFSHLVRPEDSNGWAHADKGLHEEPGSGVTKLVLITRLLLRPTFWAHASRLNYASSLLSTTNIRPWSPEVTQHGCVASKMKWPLTQSTERFPLLAAEYFK